MTIERAMMLHAAGVGRCTMAHLMRQSLAPPTSVILGFRCGNWHPGER